MNEYSGPSEPRPESASSRSAWGLDRDDSDTLSGQKSTGIDIQSGGPSMVTSHQALGIRDSWLSKFGRGVRCTYSIARRAKFNLNLLIY